MRTKFYSAMLTLGLAVTALARVSHAGAVAPATSSLELAIDPTLYPTQLHFSLPKPRNSIWDLTDVARVDRSDFTELNLALSSPGLLFGAPRDFFQVSLQFTPGATTAVVFPLFSR